MRNLAMILVGMLVGSVPACKRTGHDKPDGPDRSDGNNSVDSRVDPLTTSNGSGLSLPLATCSLTDPCETPGGTVTTETDVPVCRTTRAGRVVFDDGAPLTWIDPSGMSRYACVDRIPSATSASPRPLVVFIHGSEGSAAGVYNSTSLRSKSRTFDLVGDPARAGFVLASLQGRNLQWPIRNFDGSHFDFYYRDPMLNPDVQALDHLVDSLVGEGIVDPSRIYLMGWSNGANFVQFYAAYRHTAPTAGGNRIAAAVGYGFYSPFEGLETIETPSCELRPYPTMSVPLYLANRTCDALTPCNEAQQDDLDLPPGNSIDWVETLRSTIGNPNVQLRLISTLGVPATSCDAQCTKLLGTRNHLRWPDGIDDDSGRDWEVAMLGFLRDHPM